MSQSNIQAKIRSNPKFAELVGKRTRFAVILSLVVLVPYYTYMLLVSLQPQLFAGKISEELRLQRHQQHVGVVRHQHD